MPKHNGAIHVAVTRRHYKGKEYKAVLLRRSYREDGKVKKETLGNISHLPGPIIELIRGALRGETYLPASEVFEIIRSRPYGHVAAVLGTLKKIGLEQVLASRPSKERDLVLAMIVARVLDPGSKLATARSLSAETASTSLGYVLGLDEQVSEEDLYRAMDWLRGRQRRIEAKLVKRHLGQSAKITPVLCDVSSSYYTGTHCALAAFGHSRDGKKGFPQIVFALLTSGQGCPVAVEVFEGNTGDPVTLGPQLAKLRGRFEGLVVVGDRGLLSGARIKEELRPARLDWITALRAPAIQKLARERLVPTTLFDERDLAEITSPDYPGERLIVCRNPFLADERARKREELLEQTERLFEKVVTATERERRPLRGKDRIGLRVGRVMDRYNVAGHFALEITERSFSYRRNEEKIAEEANLDGLYLLRTSLKKKHMPAPDVVAAYKNLSKVERAFRSLKTVDLKIRPIHHRLDERVRAHVFLCMLAYYAVWHMRQALRPILFDDDDPEAARAARRSIVAPAVRSEKALRKAASKRTEDDYPVHSFRTLLKDLSTLCLNTIRTNRTGAEFELLTEATPLQRRAFDLLGISPRL
ncbi:MAG: IS1634 family transposase [Thermoanaerobaculales bacterium]